MDKKVLIGIAGAVIVGIAATALVLGGGANAATGKYTYETVTVGKGDVARVISASGAVQPREKVDVGSEVSGKITAIYVDFNDPVKKDQVLAQVDPETFQNVLDQARARQRQSEAAVDNNHASINRAKVALDVAEKNFTRQKALFDQQAISQQAWELADQTYTNAKLALQTEEVSLKSSIAGLETARATVQDAITKLERTKIRSPIDGVILSRTVEVGQTVQSSQTVAKFFVVAADLSQIEIEAAVVESDIGGIDNGDPVVFTVDAFPGERFQGSVVQVRQLGAETANVVTYTVVVNARNPNGKLLPGMTANVEITADRATDVLRIAYDATRFQPPKEVAEAMRAEQERNGEGSGGRGPGGQQGAGAAVAMGEGGQRPQGGGRGGERRGPGPQFGEMLKTAGVDEARVEKIMSEMQGEMQRAMASIPNPQQQQGGAGAIVGGPGFGPPQSILQQQAMQERRAKMQQTQEAVFRRNLNEQEYAAVSKAMSEMQSQKRVTVYKLDDKGQLERHMLTIGLSDGSNAQIIRGAKEGDTFVVRAATAGKGEQK
ncbi:MAG TPA: efflux RND transporter periplasmic adaptor subunit [Hyphomonadaceae bacterium]|nr:efflux RND transporter periplasmic adaptor subunit [Hyphomonadaceae bacterium]